MVQKEKQRKLIGLTGMYCAGKNYVAGILEEHGLPVLDVDKLGHKVIEAEKDAIVKRFGPSILREDGTIDRRLLGALVFGRPVELAALEGIIHPAANRMTEEWIARQGGACVINAALLHRSTLFKKLDYILIVKAPFITRLFRARKRDGLPWRVLLTRFKSQKEFNSQYPRKKADIYNVSNNGCGFAAGIYRKNLENRIDSILVKTGTILTR
ncbi:MAG: dephospho-CoA kinase [Treponema sp.]|jgi:dephospho-CoA kinase|nr:dephospho-CoA kinase [Treponema sp.]